MTGAPSAHSSTSADRSGSSARPVGRRVVVAGASSDAGRAVCAALMVAGAHVIALGSNASRLASVPASEALEIDLQDSTAVDALAARIGPIDGLIHLVGGWNAGRDDAGWGDLERRILHTLRNTTRAFEPALADSTDARLLIVSSTAVDAPSWGSANYAAIKSAAETWVRALARRWRKEGTAAAVIVVVRSLGRDGTPVQTLGETVAALWDAPAPELNGARIQLTGAGE